MSTKVINPGKTAPSPDLHRAARLSSFPGITLDGACKRFGVKKAALQRARKELGPAALRPTRDDLVLAILTDYATLTEGKLPADLAQIASYIDFVEKDGCTPAAVRATIEALTERKIIEIEQDQWKLLGAWP